MKIPLRELNIYPIKSCRGLGLTKLTVTSSGPVGDRMWMLVDDNGQFLSQRTLPKMATLETHFDGKALTIGFNKQFFVVPPSSGSRQIEVKIWNDTVPAALEADLYSQAISQYLGMSCRLVRYTDVSQRKLASDNESWAPEVRFADQRPLLLVNLKSLADLNGRLPAGAAVPISRFRANIVCEGGESFVEESWKRIRIGEVVFSNPKKASRCKIITLDQTTGDAQGPEPLKTLAEYRREGIKVNFGVLWTPENAGVISLEDFVEVLA